MWLHYFDPHAPYTPPEPYTKMYYSGDPRDLRNKTMEEVVYPKRWIGSKYIEWLHGVTDIQYPISQYMGEVSYLDEQIGELLQKLYKYGLQENTMIIFTSDHGESLSEHHIYFAHAGLYEVTVKVPLIIWFPQKIGHKAVESLVMSVDIMPTVLDFFGLEFPSGIRGKSFLPILHGKEEEIHEQIFCEHVSKTQAMIRNKKWKYIKSLRNWHFGKKFLFTNGDRELYDLNSDPEELNNITNEYPEITEEFDQQLVAWLKDKKAITKPVKTPEVKEEVREKLRALGYLQ